MSSKTLSNIVSIQYVLKTLGNRAAMKGLVVAVAMAVFSQLTACFAIVNYSVIVFKQAGTSIDPYLSSIILAVAVLLGSLTTTYLADKLGRKILNFLSTSLSAAGLLTVSLYHYLRLSGYDLAAFSWIPVTSLSFVAFVSSAGIIPLILVVGVEYMPPKVLHSSTIILSTDFSSSIRFQIRTFGMTFAGFILNCASFTSTKIFPILLDELDLHGCLMIYGFGSIVAAIIILLVSHHFFLESLSSLTHSFDKYN